MIHALLNSQRNASQPFDIASSIDVLEHISRENLSNTLFEISELTRKFFFFCVDLLPASKNFWTGEILTFYSHHQNGGCNRSNTIFQ